MKGETRPVAWDQSESIDQIAAALSAAQGEFEAVHKAESATITSRREGAASYSYKYASLADMIMSTKSVMAKNGLAYLSQPFFHGGFWFFKSKLVHSSGQWFACILPLVFDESSVQSFGSAVTYMRRYGMCCLTGIVADADDDGRKSEEHADRRRQSGNQPQSYQPRQQANPAANRSQAVPNWGQHGEPVTGHDLWDWTQANGLVTEVYKVVRGMQWTGKINDLDDAQVEAVVAHFNSMRARQGAGSTKPLTLKANGASQSQQRKAMTKPVQDDEDDGESQDAFRDEEYDDEIPY